MGKKREIIEIGKTYKKWLVLEYLGKRYNKEYYLCTCLLCNINYEKDRESLIRKNRCFSCHSCAQCKDLTGQRFGRLTVIAKHSVYKGSDWTYLTRCDCGTEKVINGTAMKYGETVSCGCYYKEISKITHSGENSNFWKGGVSTPNKLERQKVTNLLNPVVRKRDNHTCQHCNQYGGYLNVHHIFDFSTYPK